ncbi:hypothetical protein [Pseudomonas sp. NPDC089734]|uniref:hypothetical protein n=1 Tax=Pseudomonas sp. NPDC089734 TaxID=3364469 RepID=UPI00381FEEC6
MTPPTIIGFDEKALSIQYLDVTPPRRKKPAGFNNFFRARPMERDPGIAGGKASEMPSVTTLEAKIKALD